MSSCICRTALGKFQLPGLWVIRLCTPTHWRICLGTKKKIFSECCNLAVVILNSHKSLSFLGIPLCLFWEFLSCYKIFSEKLFDDRFAQFSIMTKLKGKEFDFRKSLLLEDVFEMHQIIIFRFSSKTDNFLKMF